MESIRELTIGDLEALVSLSSEAGWNQSARDWGRLLELEPHGCLGIEAEGRLAATATVVAYGRELAWVGMVLTHPGFRGRGFGSAITARAVEIARARGALTVKLDATDMGKPIYERLGFRDEQPIERYQRQPQAGALPTPAASPPSRYEPDPALDREAFGADRSALLASLAREQALSLPGGGFAMARVGSRAVQLGPCVARTRESARSLMHALAAAHAGRLLYWDLLPSGGARGAAAELAAELGFVPVRRLSRMSLSLGAESAGPPRDDSLVWAAAGFEYG